MPEGAGEIFSHCEVRNNVSRFRGFVFLVRAMCRRRSYGALVVIPTAFDRAKVV